MPIVASGQLSLVDLNDSKQLVAYVGSSQARSVIYSPNTNTYVPNYASTNQVLTPQLFIAGTSTDIASSAKSVKWSYQVNGGGSIVDITADTTEYTLGTTGAKPLTIKSNVLASNTSMTYICEITYTDASTGFDVVAKAEIELIKVTNGEAGQAGADGTSGVNAVLATVWTPEGNTLKNSTGSLKAQVDVYSGTTKVTPSAFKWYIQDPSATTTSGGDADGGAGWRLLNATYNAGVTGYTTAIITIPASAIASVESFKCVATYNSNKYQDVCTVIDVTDPIVVTVVGLNTFKNGTGSQSMTAKLYQNGTEIDTAGTGGYTYSWSLYKQDGTKDTVFGTKTGKTITVNATDVDVRANLICEVSK